MAKAIKTLAWIVVGILALDFVGFVAWAMSGQIPADGFYLGAITTNIIQAIIY